MCLYHFPVHVDDHLTDSFHCQTWFFVFKSIMCSNDGYIIRLLVTGSQWKDSVVIFIMIRPAMSNEITSEV